MNGLDEKHVTTELLRKYVRNELSHYEREQVDQELLVCEGCMWLFMSVMEEDSRTGEPMPANQELPDMKLMEDRVIAELLSMPSIEQPISEQNESYHQQQPQPAPIRANGQEHKWKQKQKLKSRSRRSWLHHPAAHYTIAASITLLLLATGALSQFTHSLQQIEEKGMSQPPSSISSEWIEQPRWSDQLVNRAGSWLDTLQERRFK